MNRKLSTQEIELIPKLYRSSYSVRKIAKKMHTSDKYIKQILLDNGIDINNPSCVYAKHKPHGYWSNKSNCLDAAKKCESRIDFKRKYSAAYAVSLREGWINEFNDFFVKKPNFYGFYHPIHVVYAYEVGNAVYVGRTINLSRRHNSHIRGTFVTQHKTYNDTLFNYCKQIGVDIPEPKILESGLTAEESQTKEGMWVTKYKNEGWIILNKATTGTGSGSLGAVERKWTYQTCKEAALLCKSKIDYRKKFPTASRVAIQNKWIDEFFVNIKKDNGYFGSLENCINEAKNYKNLTDIKKNYPFLYHKICENKWNNIVKSSLVCNGLQTWDINELR